MRVLLIIVCLSLLSACAAKHVTPPYAQGFGAALNALQAEIARQRPTTGTGTAPTGEYRQPILGSVKLPERIVGGVYYPAGPSYVIYKDAEVVLPHEALSGEPVERE